MKDKTIINVSEDEIIKYGKSLLEILLLDRTTGRNIIWGISDYEQYGDDYKAQLPISVELITGANKNIIQPRIYKEKTNQNLRTKDKAEVFTPLWVCNEQNNLVDAKWFGRKNVFNKQIYKQWKPTTKPIKFSQKKGKQWTDYVDEKRLEITCGEAPYLVSRYDTVTGEAIPLGNRIGLLDRKLRIVAENTTSYEEWIKWSKRAFESIYGFEYQGDNLLLARKNKLYTFIDFYKDKYGKNPTIKELKPIAQIISWNIWQMDGLKYTVPLATVREQYYQMDMFNTYEENEPTPYYCKIRDWRSRETLTFASLLEKK